MKSRKLRHWILVADLIWAAFALLIAHMIRYGVGNRSEMLWRPFSSFGPEFVAALVGWVVLHEWIELDGFRGGWYLPAVFSRIFLGVSSLMIILLAGAYLIRNLVSRLVLAYFGLALFLGFVSIRWVVLSLFRSKLAIAVRRRIVVVGSGSTAREVAAKIERHPESLCRVVGRLMLSDSMEGDPEFAGPTSSISVRTLGVVDLLKEQEVEEVILVGAGCSHSEMLNLAARCRNKGIQVSLVPELYELYLSRPDLMDLDGLPVLRLSQITPLLSAQLKRVLDLGMGTLLAVPATPILMVAAILLRFETGKAFRWETRVGKHAQPFQMLRLNVDREVQNPTVLERVLSQLSITELPQLVNVLKGDMSLVGPRPESPDRAKRYTEWERQRLMVRPGMTGLAQVHGLREQHSSQEKCRFDLQYLLDCSPFLDLTLLLQTIWTLIARSHHGSETPVREWNSLPVPGAPLLGEVVRRAHRTQPSAD